MLELERMIRMRTGSREGWGWGGGRPLGPLDDEHGERQGRGEGRTWLKGGNTAAIGWQYDRGWV